MRRAAQKAKATEAEATRRFLKETAPALTHIPTTPLEEFTRSISSPTVPTEAQRRRLDLRRDKRLARRMDVAERRHRVAEVFGMQ